MTNGQPTGGAGPAIKSPLARNLQAAIDHHRAGRFDDAERLYNEILATHPEHPDALQFLGVLAGQRGTPDAAIDYLTRAIAVNRRNPVYHYNLGLAYQAAKKPDEAGNSFKRTLELEPTHIEALKGMGGALLALGRLDEAERYCRRAVGRAPGDPRVHNNLATVLLGLERVEEGEASARRALSLMPNFADAHNNLGNSHLVREAYAEAEGSFRKALRLAPGHAEAHNNLGITLLGLGRLDDAIASFDAAIEANADYAAAHNGLANIYRRVGYSADAEREYREALRCTPDHTNALVGLGEVLIDRGDTDGALAHYDDMMRRDPDSPTAHAGKAWILELKGDIDGCYEIVRPLIDAGQPNAAIAALFGRMARRFDRRDEAAELIERMLTDGNLTSAQRQLLHFTLGKLYDADDAFDEAFSHFAEGNALNRPGYQPVKFTDLVDRTIAFYDAERIAGMPRASNRAALPVFIIGMPRSGTTLTEQIIASHGQVFGGGELEHIGAAARHHAGGLGKNDRLPECLGELGEADLDRIAGNQLVRLNALGGDAARVTDKMPNNFLRLGFINQLFAGARIVHCVRDPLDTCLSNYMQNFTRGNLQSNDLGHLGAYFNDYRRLMDHWRVVLGLPIMDIVYEDLVADLEGKSRELIDFIGLEWDPQCLRFHESGRVVNTASYDQVRQPIYNRSVGRWRHYEHHLGPLKDALAEAS